MPRREFYGGPWDGEVRQIHEGDAVHIHLDSMPGPAQSMDALDDEVKWREPRTGVYRLQRRRDRGFFYEWIGE